MFISAVIKGFLIDRCGFGESSSDEISERSLLKDCGMFSIIRGEWFDLL